MYVKLCVIASGMYYKSQQKHSYDKSNIQVIKQRICFCLKK